MPTPSDTTMTNRMLSTRRALTLASAAATLAGLVACHGAVTESLLTATDPDLINPDAIQNADGATALRNGALARLRSIAGGSESPWLFPGLLADEWTTSSTFIQNDEADERRVSLDNGTVLGQFRTIAQTRTYANQAIAAMKTYLPTQTANIAELYFARGFAEAQLAQDFCNGIPLSDGSGATLVYGNPLTNDQVFTVAVFSYDTAITMTSALTDAFGVSINRAAKIAKARALMGRNDYAGASALVAGIPTSYSYDVTFATSSGDNILWNQPASSRRYNLGDTLVTTSAGKFTVKPSIPFSSAKDPRLPAANSPANTKSQDGSVISWTTTLWSQTQSVPVVNGIDARLIEAENFLKLGDVTNWLARLNALRTDGTLKLGTVSVPVMTQLADPGTTADRVDLQFYEKAFWTFSRGQRLSDLRRLIRQYGRDQSTLFPSGSHYRGVAYGTDVNFPIPLNEQNSNPNAAKGCTDRKA